MKLLDMIKSANANKNKQQHRTVGGTREAKRLQSMHSGWKGLATDLKKDNQGNRDLDKSDRDKSGTNSKTDI